MRLKGKRAFITGAGSGIGWETARLMVLEGAQTALVSLPSDDVERKAKRLRQDAARPSALGVSADVSDEAQVKNAVEAAVKAFGGIDILVASAGIQLHLEDRDLHTLKSEAWDRTHNVNYRGVFLTVKHVLNEMVESGSGGSVAIVSSVTGLSGFSANPAYLSGKHGLIGLSRHVAVHYGRYGVRCNAVCPGALERTPNHEEHPDPKGRAERFEARVPLGRLGSPAEIANALVFLSSDEASYINGACLTIDGGLSAA